MLLASIQGPSSAEAISVLASNILASLVNLTDGRACRPTAWVIFTCVSALTVSIPISMFRIFLSVALSHPSERGKLFRCCHHRAEQGAAGCLRRRHHRALDNRRIADADL